MSFGCTQQLSNGYASLEAAARASVEAMVSSTPSSSIPMVTKEEFAKYLFPHLAVAKSGASASDIWEMQQMQTNKRMKRAQDELDRLIAEGAEITAVRSAREPEQYGEALLHRDVTIEMKNRDGTVLEWIGFGSVLQVNNTYKLYSFRSI